MGIVENIKSLQAQGMEEDEIIRTLQSHGILLNEINDAISQTKIKEAVLTQQESSSTDINTGEMHPSISAQQPSAQPSTQLAINENLEASQPKPSYQQGYEEQPQAYQDYGYDQYSGISADTINEIAEQVMLENLAPLKNKLEQALEFKDIVETKISYIDERLKRLEKIIDRLQLSVLQKVGEYMANVEDIKKEMQETQKSFKSLIAKSSPQKDVSQTLS